MTFICHAAPAGAILNGTAATNGNYDDGDVCAAEANAFVYVKNICTDTTQGAVSLTVTVSLLLAWHSVPLSVHISSKVFCFRYNLCHQQLSIFV